MKKWIFGLGLVVLACSLTMVIVTKLVAPWHYHDILNSRNWKYYEGTGIADVLSGPFIISGDTLYSTTPDTLPVAIIEKVINRHIYDNRYFLHLRLFSGKQCSYIDI